VIANTQPQRERVWKTTLKPGRATKQKKKYTIFTMPFVVVLSETRKQEIELCS
jgi:hypothetical protein